MPMSSPTGPHQTEWSVTARSVTAVGGYNVHFRTSVDTDNPASAQVIPLVQQFVDLLDASSDFVLV